jgi:hypothetical protein
MLDDGAKARRDRPIEVLDVAQVVQRSLDGGPHLHGDVPPDLPE